MIDKILEDIKQDRLEEGDEIEDVVLAEYKRENESFS